ncbi:MAG: CRISPR-associated protein Cas4 [Candidatus Hadarchaeales archaeon]
MNPSGRDGELSVWEVYQYFYCPRKLYFIRKLGLYPPERKKMEAGSREHDLEERRSERRKEVYGVPAAEVEEIMHDIPLEDRELGLYGRADTVLRLRGGEIVPVDVKYSDLKKVSLAWRKQMVAYAVLLEKAFGVRIKRGLIYTLPRKLVLWVNIQPEERIALASDLERMRQLLSSDSLPRAVSSEKCGYCEVEKFCRRI